MEFVIFLAVFAVGVIFELVGAFLGCPSVGVIAAIGCATAIIVDAIKNGRKNDR